MATVNEFTIELHPKQIEILNHPARFKVIACGRRFGKTTLCAYIVAIMALTKANARCWLVAPTFPQTDILWEMVIEIIPKPYIREILEGKKCIILRNGAKIWAKSADNPKTLVGRGLDLVVVDEASVCDEMTWHYIRPALGDRKGCAVFPSTPKGKNWFYQLFLREQHDENYKSFRYSSYENPTVDPKEFDSMQSEMPDLIYRQEIMADFIDSGGEVFRNFKKVLGPTLKGPEAGRSYVVGVDLAKYADFTVLSVADTATNEIVALDRFNRLDWDYQKEKVRAIAKQYNDALLIVDSTGVGDPIVEDLKRMDLSVMPVKFTSVTKSQLINHLMLMVDQSMIKMPDDPELIHEFETFEYDITGGGNFTYGAPKGMHDDIVISVALAAWGLEKHYCGVVGMSEESAVPAAIEVTKEDQYVDWKSEEDDRVADYD